MDALNEFVRNNAVFEYARSHEALMWWLGASSAVMFFGTLALVPFLVVKIPEDYFMQEKRHIGRWDDCHPALKWTLIVLKNLAGAILVLAGLAMMPLPGQGAIVTLIGVMLVDFPGKFRLERWIISKRPIHRAINWMRAKAHYPPLKIPEKAEKAGTADERR